MRLAASIVAVLLLALPGAGGAHELLIRENAGGYTLLTGHADGELHGGAGAVPVPMERILRIAALSESGAVDSSLELPEGGNWPLRPAEPPAALYAMLVPRYWTKTVEGTKNLSKDEVARPLESWLSVESIKQVLSWSDALTRPLLGGDGELEIVPLDDPLALRPGDKLHLVVTVAGAPAEGAIVTVDGRPRGATDGEGRINVKLRRAGLQSIGASYRAKGDGVRADTIVRTSILCFVIGEER